MKPGQEEIDTYRERLKRMSRAVALARALIDMGGSIADSINTVREYDGEPWRDGQGRIVLGVGLCGDDEREYLAALESSLVSPGQST